MSEREAEAYYEAQRERDEHERQCAEADLAAKLEGKRLFRVEVTRTYVGYVIADGEVEAASFAPKIIEGDEDYDEGSNVYPTGPVPHLLHKSDLTYHSLGGDITVAEYLAAKGGAK